MKYKDLPEKLRDCLLQNKIFLNAYKRKKNPEKQALRKLEKLEKSSRKWRSYNYLVWQAVKKIRKDLGIDN